jgi:hypothetical protein
VLALPYASKVTAFMDRLGLPTLPLGQEEHAGPLLARIDRLWEEREACRQLLQARTLELREDARRTARIIADAIATTPSHPAAALAI